MLYTRNAFYFRKFYKENIARERGYIDLNFVGSLHPDKNRNETGFSKLIYGNREDLGKLLGTIALNVAADDQAVYELIQNADDCKSSFFSVSYNEKYLLCINNGNYFSDQDMSAIINVAGNYKEGEDIGTFGIGFKILHRLVGADDGREAIINDYAGPIIFSWNKFYQLNNFLNDDEIRVGFDTEKDNDNAWLVKLLYTCFPCNLGERIKLQDYDTEDIKFTESELLEMREFLKKSLQHVNLTEDNYLKSGSIFFLKLGEGKSKFLDDGIDKIKSGLSYSFKFLNSLEKIYVNGEEIKAKRVADYSYTFPIGSQEFNDINPKNKKRDIKFTFAYYRDYKRAENLRSELAPNLYTFFSMDEEKNGFSFILHCNAFDMNNDRRKLQANSQINEKLLPLVAENITQYIDSLKEIDKNLFLSLYANLLLSKEPKSKPHINNNFFKCFNKYILQNIPTFSGYSSNPENVKIKDTFLEISPADFNCSEIEWFYWNNEKKDNILINEARNSEKLNLDKWNIIDLIKYAVQQNKVEEINDWIQRIEFETLQLFVEEKEIKEGNNLQEITKRAKPYYILLSEINKNVSKSNFEFVSQIKFFKFSDDNFYSLNEIFDSENLILNYEKTFDIRYELQHLGFITSIINIDTINKKGIPNYSNIKDLIQPKISDKQLFQNIASKVKFNSLRKASKHKLFIALQEFDGVGVEKLRDIELFKNSRGDVYPLRNLLKGDLSVPNWLFDFKIHITEYTPELDKYLVQENEIYPKIILNNWDDLISGISNISDFYQKVKFYYDRDEDNTPFKKQAFVYIDEDEKFIPQSEVFFNSKMLDLGNQYMDFQSAIKLLLNVATPNKQILKFLNSEPFKVERRNIFEDWSIIDETELSLEEIKTVLNFCKYNSEHFFENAVIEKQDKGFIVSDKSKNVYQVRPPSKEIREFLEQNLAKKFKVLPYELDEDCKGESGIIHGEKLYDLILDDINIDNFKEELIEIISYDEPKRKFLLQLSEVRLIENETYNQESFEYKVLEWACKYLKEDDLEDFRDKIIIKNNGYDLLLSDIPPFADKIKIEDTELRLSEVLPETYQNSNVLSKIIDDFVALKLDKDMLKSLFGVNDEPEPEKIYELLLNGYSSLQNAQQLAFLLLCDRLFEVNFEKFEVETLDEKSWSLIYTYYSRPLPFIGEDCLLKNQYENINELISLPYKIGKSDNFIIEKPYFTDDQFICPCIKSDLIDEEKVRLIDYIYYLWDKEIKKEIVNNIDWSKIGELETENLLGFNPKYSVYPNEFACDSERLPDYLTEWIEIENNNNKIDFLSDIGVWTESSSIVELRKFWKNGGVFSSNLERETRFDKDETMLINSFAWLKENDYVLSTNEQYEILKKVLEIIKENCQKTYLEIDEEFDFEKIEEKSIEWSESYYQNWKEKLDNKFTIFLYDSKLPKTVKLDEFGSYIFHSYHDGDVVIDKNNRIFINQNADIKKALSSLIAEDDNDFSAEDLLLIYQAKETTQTEDDEVEELKSEVERLRQRIAELEGVSRTASYSPTIVSYDDYHDKIKEKSERYLFYLLKDVYEKVKWLNYNESDDCFVESWANHDFEILDSDGNVKHYIDCKGTPQQKRTFYLTNNEWSFFLDCIKNDKNYQIYRVFDIENQPNHILIDNLWAWIEQGKVVPYLTATETIKGGRVFLTLT